MVHVYVLRVLSSFVDDQYSLFVHETLYVYVMSWSSTVES